VKPFRKAAPTARTGRACYTSNALSPLCFTELVSVIGVRFKPGGAFPFLGTSASELADVHVDLEALWGTSAMELRERLCVAKTPAERFNLLEKALVAHLFRPLERHYAVRFALDTFGRADSGVAIRDVARDAGLSQRRFIQLFGVSLSERASFRSAAMLLQN
jgi:hypothetical protein